ncbi:MAG TPA: type II toxin-antitoxin system VapC family toxin [Hanamia sp.]|nr:type II toxin-antitoxin system VapC family toxin [Hanamia sp.]
MVEQYLLDTNPVIDFFNSSLPIAGKNFIAGIEPTISIISYIELLSNKNIPKLEWNQLLDFVQIAVIYDLKKEIVEQTIILRQNFKIKTPDAIVAATALVHNKKLITRNISDFKNIPGLTIIDPSNL